jgi:hypothetical protein
MTNAQRLNLVLWVYLTSSALGLMTIIAFVFFPPKPTSDIAWRKPFIGIMFILICVLGGSAAIIPKKCSKIFGSHKAYGFAAFSTVHSGSHVMSGHHPDCGRFSPHTINVSEHVLCAACTGLFLGAIVAVVGATTYFFAGLDIEQFSLPLIAIGLGCVALGFVQFRFSGFIRLLLNVFFVVGVFFALAGVDALMKNLFIDFYLISLTILWILTRILLSEWDHLRICRFCELKCKLDE